LQLGQVAIDVEPRNTTGGKENRMLVRVDILDNTGTDEPFAGLIPSTHQKQLTPVCSSSTGSNSNTLSFLVK
jgi:hypothetical protein